VYLAVILDAFSRRVVGWALSRHIDAALTVSALRMAIERRGVQPGLVHHSDQGVQYACDEYVQLLQRHDVAISMSRKGNPYDNAMAESFMKTLKAEEVYLNEYTTISEAYTNIEHFIEIVYNKKRLHSSLGYLPPEEFEAQTHNKKSTLATENFVSAMG
jgi:transposase InsO family protein